MTSTKTGIEWTERTWNPLVGCAVVSPGCTNCYAMRMAARLERMGVDHYRGLTMQGKNRAVWTGQACLAPQHILLAPLHWKKPCRVFVNSMSDLFFEQFEDADIRMVFAIMAQTPHITYQVLTKRPARMASWLMKYQDMPLPNVWLGVSVEDQRRADSRIPWLQCAPAAVRFLSCEPLLEAICPDLNRIDLVICGGESGPGFREMKPEWAQNLMADCAATDTAFFMKQMAGKKPIPPHLMLRQLPTLCVPEAV